MDGRFVKVRIVDRSDGASPNDWIESYIVVGLIAAVSAAAVGTRVSLPKCKSCISLVNGQSFLCADDPDDIVEQIKEQLL